MEQSYQTLDTYNQYMQETRDTVLSCDIINQDDVIEQYESLDSHVLLDASLNKTSLHPEKPIKDMATCCAVLDLNKRQLYVSVKLMNKMSSPSRCSFYTVREGRLDQERLLLFHSHALSNHHHTSEWLVKRKIRLTKQQVQELEDLIRQQALVIVISTRDFPNGYISGFVRILHRF